MIAADPFVWADCIASGQVRSKRRGVPQLHGICSLFVSDDATWDLLQVLKQRELRLVSCQESIRNPPLSLFDAKLQSLA